MSHDVVIVPSLGGTPQSFWFPWLTKELSSLGKNVWCPELDDPEHHSIDHDVPFLLNGAEFSSDTVVVGHSSTCSLLLVMLERLDIKIKRAILVSGFYRVINDSSADVIPKSYDAERIKSHCDEIIMINSDDDPWLCTDTHARDLSEKLGGLLITAWGQGHMGSELFHQSYLEFPLVKSLVLK